MKNETIDKLKNAGYITVTDDSQGIADKVGISGGGGSDAGSVIFNNFFKSIASDFIQPHPTKVLAGSNSNNLDLTDISTITYPEEGLPTDTRVSIYFLYKEEDALKIKSGESKGVIDAFIEQTSDMGFKFDYTYAINGLSNAYVLDNPVEIDGDTYYRFKYAIE